MAKQLSTISMQSFILTEKEYMGLASPATKEGDIVCVLFGYQAPVVLRPVDDCYIFIGDCFVFGLMDREALQDLTGRESDFRRVRCSLRTCRMA
jgi:hypothetical protein